ncbi:HD domain-containing protein [Cryptosporangium phraense]|uniref:HD domain-containing protein n=1 Tax=Cryptosporangium phraense TaxID=2593070 RepID=A0A545AUP1_9ACTN|nr:HD domain-containing protein [Cryptosporangium phraense]TQS45058.1 HD domain-containing protein [Cryptosporangium phraense]
MPDILQLDPEQLTADEFCDRLFAFLETAGRSNYDEAVTQLQHALQCAELAEAAGFGPSAQVAALLHDLGHLVLGEDGESAEEDQRHEIIGARLVTRWFGAEAGGPVALHVAAKRYLVATDPAYFDGLSPASVNSLALQGGPMTPDEVAKFERLPQHEVAVELRRWDDLAKDVDAEVPGLEHWRPAITALLTSSGPGHPTER